MCGLAGIFHGPEAAAIDSALLRRMTAALHHRGPDGDGFHVEPGIGLGHRRLAVIDLAGGRQPMANEDGSVVIAFNGEIYDHAALRARLEAAGHVFRTGSDTETIVHAWESWGPDCLEHLSGMFAFAIWDRNRQTLFLARDHLGKKPLYYAFLPDGRFVFASEMRALTVLPDLPRRLDEAAVDDFFAYGYVPDPASIYRDVRKLPAAHYLLLRRGGPRPAPRRYWRLPGVTRPVDATEAGRELALHLTEAVARRLVADVPVGAFLSGGIDSGCVVAVAAGLRRSPLATYTIGFPGAADERAAAALVARRYGTLHVAEAETSDPIDAAREQARLYGEPFGDPSSLPTARVAALARAGVTVALSGDGGDEVFAGYRRYRWHMLAEAVRGAVPAPLRRGVLGRLARIYPKLDRAPRWLRARHTLTELSLDSALGYYATLARTDRLQRRALFSAGLARRLDGHDPAARIAALMDESGSDDALLRAQHVDLNTWLPGDILTKVDRASMAVSLEVRAPLLDRRLVEWGATLPRALKLQGGEGKAILRRHAATLLPDALLHRPKQGFAASPAACFRAGTARLEARLLRGALPDSGLFDLRAVGRLIEAHAGGGTDHSHALSLLLAFEGFLTAEQGPDAAPASRSLAKIPA